MDKKKKKTLIISLVSVGVLVTAGIGTLIGVLCYQESIYKRANELLYQYELDESESLFSSIYYYKDSKNKIGVIHGIKTLNETGNYNKAIEATTETGGIIEVNFSSIGTQVDPVTIKEKTTIDEKSYLEHYDFFKWDILSYHLIEDSHSFQLNLNASFSPHVYSIEYDVGDGFVIDPVTSYTYGTSVVATNAYCDGYTFTGYTVGDDPTLYNPFVVKETDGTNFLLTAHYAPVQYTYTFDPNGGTCDVTEGTYTFGQVYLLPYGVKDGYNFTGWYTDYGKKLENKININENTTLYAHYETKQYKINYQLRGGQFLEEYPTGYNKESADINIPYPNRDGYLFVGWVTQDQTSKASDINYTVPTGSEGDITLYACWRAYTSSYGNSYISSLGDFDLPDVYPYDVSELIPSYVIPYNITSFAGSIFKEEAIKMFGVEKLNSTFSVIGGNKYLVSKDETKLYRFAFSSLTSNIDLILPSSITEIKDYALAYSPLDSVMSSYVTTLGEGAFNHSSIKSFSLPNASVYGANAFLDCHNLVSADSSLLKATYIGDKCFLNTKLSTVTVGEDVSYLGSESFGGSASYHYLTSFTCLSTKFDSLENVFKGQTSTVSLTLAKLPNSVKTMFGSTDVHIDTINLVGVKDIPDEFLYEITDISALTDTVNIETIGDRAFSGADVSLIPDLSKVTYIGASAFEGCSNLENVTLGDIKTIKAYAFKDSGLRTINLPASIETIEDGVFEGCENLEKIIFESPLMLENIGSVNRLFGEHTFASNLDIEVRGEGTLPIKAFQNLYVGKSVTLGDKVNLSEYAFSNATSIESITFNHDRNTIIPYGCFENASSLETFDLTNIVTIYNYAFNNCSSLTTFTIDGEANNTLNDTTLRDVRDHAFGNLLSITSLSIKGTPGTITFGKAVFANDTFEIDLYDSISLSADTLIDYQGFIVDI